MKFIKEKFVNIGATSKGFTVPKAIRNILEKQNGDYFKINIEKMVSKK